MEEKEREKEIFFEGLYELDERDDDVENNIAALILRKSRKTVPQTFVAVTPQAVGGGERSAATKHSRPIHITRTESAPLPLIDSLICQEVERVKDSPAVIAPAAIGRQRRIAPKVPVKNLRRRTDGGIVAAKEVSKMPAKRKREKSLQMVPEPQQIFRGLQFCMDFTVNYMKLV